MFANMFFHMMNKDPKKRITEQTALTHPALTHMIFSKDVLDAVHGEGYLIPGRCGPPGSKFQEVECPGWLLKPDGPDGAWGTGCFAARSIKEGELAGWYAGAAHDLTDKSSMTEYPPCFANVTIFDGQDPNLTAIGELPLEVLCELRAPGVFFNAKPAVDGANLRLERKEQQVSEGRIIMIPLYATSDIAEGEGGYWPYTPGKGMGGADSYMFRDYAFWKEQADGS